MQEMIDSLVALSLNSDQCRTLSRRIGIEPSSIFADSDTNYRKIEALVERARQLGIEETLSSKANELCSKTNLQKTKTIGETNTFSKLDTAMAIKFGELYNELLLKIGDNGGPSFKKKGGQSKIPQDLIDFEVKLKDIAKFSPSNCVLGVDSKNNNSVLKRKAKKLGYNKYEEIIIQIIDYYSKRILTQYPPSTYNADKRLDIMAEELFEFLPENLQDADAPRYLNGLIFDTTSQCKIFNE